MNASKQAVLLTQLPRLAASRKAWAELGRRLSQRLARPVSLGVRGMVFDAEGRVLLVRHTYLPGWYMPGGGVEPGESLAEALARELAEEAHVSFDARPLLHGIFLRQRGWHSNHVACFVVRGARQSAPRAPDWEIAEVGFFAPEALPEETSPATRARIAEVLGNLPPASVR